MSVLTSPWSIYAEQMVGLWKSLYDVSVVKSFLFVSLFRWRIWQSFWIQVASVSSALKISTVESLPLAMEVSHRASPFIDFLVNLFLSTLFLWTHYICFRHLWYKNLLSYPLPPFLYILFPKRQTCPFQSSLTFILCVCVKPLNNNLWIIQALKKPASNLGTHH